MRELPKIKIKSSLNAIMKGDADSYADGKRYAETLARIELLSDRVTLLKHINHLT